MTIKSEIFLISEQRRIIQGLFSAVEPRSAASFAYGTDFIFDVTHTTYACTKLVQKVNETTKD